MKSARVFLMKGETMTPQIRQEDKAAIRHVVEILSTVCSQHERCETCPLLKDDEEAVIGCVLDKPPVCFDADEIIECFT